MFYSSVKPTLLWASVGILLVLIIASLIIGLLTHHYPDKNYDELKARLRSWWWMAGMFIFAILFSQKTSLFLLGFISFLALKEYFSLIPTRRADRRCHRQLGAARYNRPA